MNWLQLHHDLLAWIGGVTLAASLLSPIAIIWLIEQLPADYFIRPRAIDRHHLHPLSLMKNLFGLILIVAGVAMLVLPGQGVLTMLIGLVIMNFPGKKALEKRLLRLPKIAAAVNWIRKKGGKPPFILPPSPGGPKGN